MNVWEFGVRTIYFLSWEPSIFTTGRGRFNNLGLFWHLCKVWHAWTPGLWSDIWWPQRCMLCVSKPWTHPFSFSSVVLCDKTSHCPSFGSGWGCRAKWWWKVAPFLFLNRSTKMAPVALRLQKGVSLQFLMASNGLISTIVSVLGTPVHFYQV